ncbi:alpha/beta hydrolase [Salinimonas marina]|uniref:Alpha/beta hydrolase n=1 Tax=Salinimonas marina TaxID=2785918 RepID=A0A7S9DVD7_9ALTE|nr:alpha/beta fold hydrolase [Salinimonas marina]QPG04677.1 alpha/beta hydrolase [Salinimonas marina]
MLKNTLAALFFALALFSGGCASYVAKQITSAKTQLVFEQNNATPPFTITRHRYCNEQFTYCLPYLSSKPSEPFTPSMFSASVAATTGQGEHWEKSIVVDKKWQNAFTGSVILLPGHGSSKDSWRPMMQYLNFLGFETIAVDLMGQGESKAPYGFGMQDARPLSHFIEQQTAANNGPLIIVGHSIGALTALETKQVSSVIDAAVLLAPMRQFEDATVAAAKTYRPFAALLMPDSVLRTGARQALTSAGVAPRRTDVVALAKSVEIPIMLVAGAQDTISNVDNDLLWQGVDVYRVVNKQDSHMSVITVDAGFHHHFTQWLQARVISRLPVKESS